MYVKTIREDDLGPHGSEAALIAFSEALSEALDEQGFEHKRVLVENRHRDVIAARFEVEGITEEEFSAIDIRVYEGGGW